MAKYADKMVAFEGYLRIQKTGEINMVSPKVREMLGISKEEHQFIMENYSELLAEYNELKVVDELLKDANARAAGEKEKGKGLDDKTVEPGKSQQN